MAIAAIEAMMAGGGGGGGGGTAPPAGFDKGFLGGRGGDGFLGAAGGGAASPSAALPPPAPMSADEIVMRPKSDVAWTTSLDFLDEDMVVAVLFVEATGGECGRSCAGSRQAPPSDVWSTRWRLTTCTAPQTADVLGDVPSSRRCNCLVCC